MMILLGILVSIALLAPVVQGQSQAISTNKDKLLTLAVQGKIAPAEPASSYSVTWDGKPKMMIGIGGINYDLKIGDKVFTAAAGDRATVGVATVAVGEGGFQGAYLNYTSIGNEVRILDGEARGDKGVIVGKFNTHVLVHFEDYIVDKLAIGDTLQVKARGTGLQIDGFDEVVPHSVTPELLEQTVTQNGEGKLEVRVVSEIPAEIVGQGAGRSSLSGVFNIQTSYPPDIEDYGLAELRFGDLVLLKDIQSDYGKGYYEGGATLGVICTGPSNRSGLGIGVTAILSTRADKLTARIDPTANIGQYLGIRRRMEPTSSSADMADSSYGSRNGGTNNSSSGTRGTSSSVLRTNKDHLLAIAVEGVVQPPSSGG